EYNLLRASIANGKILKAGTVAELADRIGVDRGPLQASIQDYNAGCDQGCDPAFFKRMERYFPVRKGPFYAREVRACVIGQTGAGLDINERAQVLDAHQRVIPGLYAAGEVLGCAVGKRYSGGGMGICNAVVFG